MCFLFFTLKGAAVEVNSFAIIIFLFLEMLMKDFLDVLLERKPLLSLETLSFSAFVILVNLIIHSSLTQGHSSHTAMCRVGSSGLQRGQVVPLSLNSEHQWPRLQWGWEG